MKNTTDTQVSKDDKQIIDTLFDEVKRYQQSSVSQRNDINEIYDAYIGNIQSSKDKSKSQEKIMKLRTEVSYIVPSIFSGQPEIEVEAIGEEDKDFAVVAEKIINYRFQNIPQFYEKIEAWVKQATVFGTSLIRAIWKFEMQDNGDGTQTPITDEPDLDVPNILDCFYNPIISDVENQPSVIFKSSLATGDVKNNPIYDYTDEMGKLNRDKIESKGNSQINQYDSTRQIGTDAINIQQASQGMVDIYERITKDKIQTVADGKERLVLREIDNPDDMLPTVKLIHEPNAIPNRFDGYGVGHNTMGLGKLFQRMLNKTLDNVSFGNNPHFLGQKGMGLDKKQLLTKAGGITEVDTGGQPLANFIQPLLVPDIKQGAIAIMNKIDDEHKRASGANDLLQGSASNKTLGQDQIASTYSSNRFELINRRFKYALADLARILFKMELLRIQSMDSEILKIFPLQAELQGGNIIYSRETVYQMLISEEAKNAKFNISVKGTTNVAKNKDLQVKQLIEGYNLFGNSLPPQFQMAWAKKFLELRGIDEIDTLVPSPEEMQAQQQSQPQGMQPINPQMGAPMQ